MPRRLDSDAARNANRTSGALEKAGPVSSDYDAYNGVQKRWTLKRWLDQVTEY